MESRVVVSALIFTIIAACSKQDIVQSSENISSIRSVDTSAIIISDWETVPEWRIQKMSEATVFYYDRKFPEVNKSVLDNGVVLVFARNLWTDEPAFKELDDISQKPLLMPFYFLPYFEKPNYTESWNYTEVEETVHVSLMVKGADQPIMPHKKIQLRYILLPKKILEKKNHTVQSVRKLSYDQLMQTFNSPA